jgi:hypothetical protein
VLPPKDDPFYAYTGPPPLKDILPGTVLKTRRVPYHILGFPTLLETTQLLYRSTSQTRTRLSTSPRSSSRWSCETR